MDLQGKKILVVGLGKTGVSLCRFLAPQGALITAFDNAAATDLGTVPVELQNLGVKLQLGQLRPTGMQGFDLIVASPGVPPELPWLQEAVAQGVPLLGELELASRFVHRPLVAISGTNGKTTTTTLVGEMLKASGKNVVVGGNIGTPLVNLIPLQDKADCLIVEVSSFQLDTASTFRPQAAALLNVTADHLERYSGFEAYVASKASLFRNQGPNEVAVLNADDPWLQPLTTRIKSRVYSFSTQKLLTRGAWRGESSLEVCLDNGLKAQFPLEQIRLLGEHNQENILAALLLSLVMGATPEACARVLARFTGLPHRMEWIETIDGVDFYDDSKGTNVGAVVKSLGYFSGPVILIAGGRDKGGDYSPLAPLFVHRVKELILIGEARERINQALGNLAPTRMATDLPHAARLAWKTARRGDVVLLSPACSSFDMFKDYAERGRIFQAAVREIADGRQAISTC
jgi:UDP-N-acetylmuramoylalanine--D-glutamate ligase